MGGVLTKLGIVRCRDFAELYFGGRTAVFTKNTQFIDIVTVTQILQRDPRRIRYEIYFSDQNGAGGSSAALGTRDEVAAGLGLYLSFANLSTFPIERDFSTDAEAVTEEQWIGIQSGAFNVSVRETILTPLPVDESP